MCYFYSNRLSLLSLSFAFGLSISFVPFMKLFISDVTLSELLSSSNLCLVNEL